MEIIKIKSTHPASQGDHVLIYKADFNPEIHKLFEAEVVEDAEPQKPAAKHTGKPSGKGK